MIGYRWLRAATRGALGMLTALPVASLVLATLIDRGPDGQPRLSLFPIALLAFDPFAWTCARNSLIFASVLTIASMAAGVALGAAMARRYPGRGVLRAGVATMLAASPACLALGFRGIPMAAIRDGASGAFGLESWSGWPAWLLWIWSAWPGAVALSARATAGAIERIRPSWRDAARLAGAGGPRTGLGLTWPLIRPAAARAAAIVFPMALVEPGAPMVLGLRRTLAFQIVEAATRPDPFPRLAVWAALTAALSLSGRRLLRWWGGPSHLETIIPAQDGDGAPQRPDARGPRAVAATVVLIVAMVVGWLPAVGLIRLCRPPGSSGWSEVMRRAWAPPIPELLAHSLTLGAEVGLVVLVLARLLRPDPGGRLASSRASRAADRLALMPPLIQGVGILALPGVLAGAGSWRGLAGWGGPAARLSELAGELDVGRNPWALLSAAVGLSVGVRLLRGWRRAAERQPDEARSGLEAARLAGPSIARARAVAALRPGRWIGGLLLAACLAAVNLAPALLFTPWMDGRTAAPGILVLADGLGDARFQAAVLALVVLAGNLAALGVARYAPAPPPEWDPDPP